MLGQGGGKRRLTLVALRRLGGFLEAFARPGGVIRQTSQAFETMKCIKREKNERKE